VTVPGASWFEMKHLPWLVFASAFVFATVTVLLFHHQLSDRQAQRDRLAREVASLEQERIRIEEAVHLHERFAPVYEQARRQGWWQPQDRLAWVEAMETVFRKVGMAGFNYTLSPTRQLLQAGDFGLRSVGIDLEMALLHGAQLLSFAHALENLGPFSWERCDIERGQGRPEPGKGNLQGVCRLEWFSILPQETPEDDWDAADMVSSN